MMKLVLLIAVLMNCALLCGQKQQVHYVKNTVFFKDSTLNAIVIEPGTHERLPYFSKRTEYSGSPDKPNQTLVYAKDTLDSTYFSLTLGCLTFENIRQLSVYHQFNYYAEDSFQENVEVFIENDSVNYSYIEVSIDGDPSTYYYQLPVSSLDYYKRLVIHQLNNPDLQAIQLTFRPFEQYGDLIRKSYLSSYETKDSTYTYEINEWYLSNVTTRDSTLLYKRPKFNNDTLNQDIHDVYKTKRHRKTKPPKPYYFNSKYTKRIEKKSKYEKRLDKRNPPSYFEIFYE